MKPKPDERVAAAIRRAAELIPGAVLELRPAVEHPTIVLPVPGLSVRFKGNGQPVMALRRDGRDRAWCNVPAVARNLEAGALRIVRELRRLVAEEVAKAPPQRERSGDLQLAKHAGCWLTPAERLEAEEAARARGMTLSGLVRRGLRMAIEEHPSAVCDDEEALRGVLRLLVAASRDRYPDNFTAIAESGSAQDVLIALRVAFRVNPEGKAAAALLGIGWIVENKSTT